MARKTNGNGGKTDQYYSKTKLKSGKSRENEFKNGKIDRLVKSLLEKRRWYKSNCREGFNSIGSALQATYDIMKRLTQESKRLRESVGESSIRRS
jgi:hypothetical protein